MPFDTSGLQSILAEYQLPVMIIGGIGAAIWFVLMIRALQVHMKGDQAQLDRALKRK